MGHSPATLRAAAVVQAVESAVVLAAAVLAGIDTAAGRSYQQGSGIALTVIGAASAAVLALVAAGLARVRRWSRTPALLTQLFFGIVGIYLLQAHRLEWGVPLLVLAAAGLAALLAPPSLRALTRQEQAKPERTKPGQAKPGQTRQARTRREPGPPGKASRRRSARPGAE
ncbi:MAG TPA: hypothetical protein VGQ26_09175 [Streptosporangiaceae bacterium]|jgi:hypothetical protein|nr:hypothetical protein [Streptosporangiaceae bacterium]